MKHSSVTLKPTGVPTSCCGIQTIGGTAIERHIKTRKNDMVNMQKNERRKERKKPTPTKIRFDLFGMEPNKSSA